MKIYEVEKWSNAIESETIKIFRNYNEAFQFILKELNKKNENWHTMIIDKVFVHNGKYWEGEYIYTKDYNYCNSQWNKKVKKLMKDYEVVKMFSRFNSYNYSIKIVEVE